MVKINTYIEQNVGGTVKNEKTVFFAFSRTKKLNTVNIFAHFIEKYLLTQKSIL